MSGLRHYGKMPPPTLSDRILCLVTDISRAGGTKQLLAAIDAAVSGGVNMVQVRAHELDEEALTALAASVVEITRGRAFTVVNGPVSAALASGADGIHLPEKASLSEKEPARAGSSLLTGMSVHSIESATRAASQGADYIILGTVFPSASHPGGPTGGTRLVSEAASAVRIPVIGIGGITKENAADVMAAGASGIAVISAIIGQNNPETAARELARAIGL